MSRPLAPAEIPAMAWQHINALPELWTARDRLQQQLAARRAHTSSYWQRMSRLSALQREALRREGQLAALGIPLDQISALAAPAPHSHRTED